MTERFSVMTFGYNCTSTVERMLANCASFVERIYVIYSDWPWGGYVAGADTRFRNTTPRSLFLNSPLRDKIELVEGRWAREEEARNEVLTRARAAGFDFCILQDPDEFYHEHDYAALLEQLSAHSDRTAFQMPWINFWKSLDWVLEYREHQGVHNTVYSHCPLVAVNLAAPVSFLRRRILDNMAAIHECSGLCHHLAWVYGDKEVWEKISTWSHAADACNAQRWFRVKWQGWRPQSRCLGVINPASVNRAVPFHGQLPRELHDFPSLPQERVVLSSRERAMESVSDAIAVGRHRLKKLRQVAGRMR